MILQRRQPRPNPRPFTTDRRGPPIIRIGTNCGRGSTHIAPRAAESPEHKATPAAVSVLKGFRGDIAAELKRKDISALSCFAAATIGVLYGLVGQKRVRGKIRSAFEAMQRDDSFLEHSVQGAIDICSAATAIVPSRVFHRALEICATGAADNEMWQALLSKMMDHVHTDTLTFDSVALELLDN